MNQLERLTVFRSTAIDDLLLQLDKALDLDEFDHAIAEIAADETNLLHAEIEFGAEIPALRFVRNVPVNRRAEQDIRNARMLHRYLGPLSRAEASDPRLWTYLSCVQFREYTESRWPLDPDGKWRRRVRDRWIVKNGSRSELVRNAISRLWWAAHVAWDPHHERPLSRQTGDPYAYLTVLLAREDRFLQLIDRDTGTAAPVLFSLLDHIRESEDHAGEGYIREIAKEAILVMGYRELAAIDSRVIGDELDSIGRKLLAQTK